MISAMKTDTKIMSFDKIYDKTHLLEDEIVGGIATSSSPAMQRSSLDINKEVPIPNEE